MKILFVMRHSGYVRNFESTLRMLCDRGNRVHLAFQGSVRYAQLDPTDIAARLAERYSNFSHGSVPLRSDGWGMLGRELRLGLDYLRYLRPEYNEAPRLRERARREAPVEVLERSERGVTSTPVGRGVMAATLRQMERAVPSDPHIDAFLRTIRPDVLALTPLIEPGSPQAEFLRSARALGVRTAFCVASWDNLTNKGLIHGDVDLVTVWNEAMRQEAIDFHGVPNGRIVVTGAAAFDHWFDWRASTSAEEFRARVGLRVDRPYLLYLCSSKFVAPQEAPFVRSWVERIRQSTSSTLREAPILVRPHPQNAEQWEDVDFSDVSQVAVWPRGGAAPVDTSSRNEYFDSMYHSAAVIGVNTTAEIESAILNRPVYTLMTPEFRDTQEGTLHFHHLRRVNGGLLHESKDFETHLSQLDAALGRPDASDERCRRFVAAFVRPHGMDVPATPRLVEALEALARTAAPTPKGDAPWTPFVRRRLTSRLAQLERRVRAERDARAAKRTAKALREAKRQAREAEQRARQAEKATREEEDRARRAERERATGRQRVEEMAADFRSFGDARRRVFLRSVIEDVPWRSLIELNAAVKPLKLDYEHADIYLHVATRGETFRLRACAKEPFTIRWIHERVRPGEVFYDIGANVGVYSLVAAKKPGGGARAYCFEASYASIASLCANVRLNDLADVVIPLPIALSDATAMNVFSLRDVEPGAARHSLGYEPPEDGPTVYRQPVMMFRLDDVLEWFSLPVPNHIKMDVDGGELSVLRGAERTLSNPALRTMLVEVSPSLSEAVTSEIEARGLALESKISLTNKAGEESVWYGVFSRDGGTGAATGSPQSVPDLS